MSQPRPRLDTYTIHTYIPDGPTDGQNSLQETFELVLETSNFVDLFIDLRGVGYYGIEKQQNGAVLARERSR